MDEAEVLQVLQNTGAFRTGHFVFTSDLHASTYINKDAIYPHVAQVSKLCRAMAEKFRDDNVEVVLGPAVGAVVLSTWTAHHMGEALGREVYGVYADKTHSTGSGQVGDDGFIIRRGYDKLIAGKRTLIVEDLMTTGGSVRKVISAARAAGADVVGAIVIANRGAVTKSMVGDPPRLESLVHLDLEQWPAEECVLCQRDIPVNTDVGHGRDFLKRKGMLQ